MWMVVLPLVMLLGMTPMLLINSDMAVQQQHRAAADIAKTLLVVHQAAVKYCKSTAACKEGQLISYSEYAIELDPALHPDAYLYLSTEVNGEVESTIASEIISNRKPKLLPAYINAEWARLTDGVNGACISKNKPYIRG
ncbi:hypothetical protein [Chromobacterium amazonense]|uniref:hypothetical protein n=1 Tax=Chromobacterium amazonense TaxID=1382803 RepID=UPI003F7A1DBB